MKKTIISISLILIMSFPVNAYNKSDLQSLVNQADSLSSSDYTSSSWSKLQSALSTARVTLLYNSPSQGQMDYAVEELTSAINSLRSSASIIPDFGFPQGAEKYLDIADGFSREHLFPAKDAIWGGYDEAFSFGWKAYAILLACALFAATVRRMIQVETVEATDFTPHAVANIGLTREKWDAFIARRGNMSKAQKRKIWAETVYSHGVRSLSDDFYQPPRRAGNPPKITPPPTPRPRLTGFNESHNYDTSSSKPPAPPPSATLPSSEFLDATTTRIGSDYFQNHNGQVYTQDSRGGWTKSRREQKDYSFRISHPLDIYRDD